MRIDRASGQVIWSASDLKSAAECEFAWARAIDAKLGRVAAVEEPENPTLERAARLGDVHELEVLQRYRDELGAAAVHEIAKASSADAAALGAAVDETVAALASDARVVFQAAFATDEFVGFADFLWREADGRWRVQDSKLARRAKSTALMQLAAYVDQLDRLGIERSDTVELLLGNGERSEHAVSDVLPLFRVRRDRLRAMIADRSVAEGSAGEALAWGDDRGELGLRACGRCATCSVEVEATRDLLLVARMRPAQREKLRAEGIHTIDELASAQQAPPRMSAETFDALRQQARLQCAAVEGEAPPFEVHNANAVHNLPLPSHGDIFFDFEGDPLYSESANGIRRDWGIDYLFGWVDNSEQYTALWAHDFAAEREALRQFLDFVALRRQTHPGLHIYHYAPYETSHLRAMAERYGEGESEVEALISAGVFVDLYPLVLRTVRLGSPSYSIKKLEPLYMGDEIRTSDVQRGDDSIVQYVAARALAAAGEQAEAAAIFADLADYNRYDCVSTLRLRNWLIDRAREAHVTPAPPDDPEEPANQPSPYVAMLQADAADLTAAGGDGAPFRMAAAALDYLPREARTFWREHGRRSHEPVSMWEQSRDVIVVDAARTRVLRDWSVDEGARSLSRELEVRGEVSPGTSLGEGSEPFAHYAVPTAVPSTHRSRAVSVTHQVSVLSVDDDGYRILERAIKTNTWDELPVALSPAAPPRDGALREKIERWGRAVHEAAPSFPRDAASDIVFRTAPRTRSGVALPALAGEGSGRDGTGGSEGTDGARDGRGSSSDRVATIARAVHDLDHSYLAVQGPPGTGKTYTGSRVIAQLVREHGYRVGVVAQSHAIVDSMLERVIEAGVDASRVGKRARRGDDKPHSYTQLQDRDVTAFLQRGETGGAVFGGTAWDFSNDKRVPEQTLDLLVIDEAGQFSLAYTIAVAASARRILLLGDPQQLPQVSQGTHPEPVDTSALGWVMGGDAVIRPDYGYFLAESWRMHPALAATVSQLAYEGKLASAPGTDIREIEGEDAGLHYVPVRHSGNATDSLEEAAQVVALVQRLIGRRVTNSDGVQRPLTQADFIVVTPYNAQKSLVTEALDAAGFPDVPVGTVDNFQGKEAEVSITTLAASSGRDAPRGPEFLLLQNRLNVAISRAKCLAYLVASPALLDDLPMSAEGVARLSAYAHLVGADRA